MVLMLSRRGGLRSSDNSLCSICFFDREPRTGYVVGDRQENVYTPCPLDFQMGALRSEVDISSDSDSDSDSDSLPRFSKQKDILAWPRAANAMDWRENFLFSGFIDRESQIIYRNTVILTNPAPFFLYFFLTLSRRWSLRSSDNSLTLEIILDREPRTA